MKESIDCLALKHPDWDKEKLKKAVQAVTKDRLNRPTNRIISVGNDKTSLMTFDKYVASEEPIVAGSGSMFKTHDKAMNILGEMISYLSAKRKAYKKLKLKYKNSDKFLSNMYDIYQLTIKRLMNSFYGVLVQSDSIFYNPKSGPAVTQSGRDIITTSINCFETFLTNSVYFTSMTDVLIYITRISKEEYDLKGRTINFKQLVTRNQVGEYLFEHMDNGSEDDKETIMDILSTMTDEQLQRIYYKNNFMKVLDNSDILENYFSKIIGRVDFSDPNDTPEDMKPILDDIWIIMENYVMYNYQEYYRWENANTRKRASILTINIPVA